MKRGAINLGSPSMTPIIMSLFAASSIMAASFLFGFENPVARMLLALASAPCVYSLARSITNSQPSWFGIFTNLYLISILILPGCFQAANGVFPFYSLRYDEASVTAAAAITFIFCTSFNIGLINAWNASTKSGRDQSVVKLNPPSAYLTTLTFCAISIALAASMGIDNFLNFRREGFGITLDPVSISKIQLARSLSFCALLINIHLLKTSKSIPSYAFTALSVTLFMIVNFPPALPRFVSFAYAISLFIIFAPLSVIKKKILSILLYPVSVLTILPLVDHLTRGDIRREFFLSIEKYILYAGDLDSFQSIINVYTWTQRVGVQHGKQVFSAIFFFIPRTTWPEKSYPTGTIAAAQNGYPYTNISAPIPGEIFSDFGWTGAIIVSALVGLIVGNVDGLAYRKSNRFYTIALCATLSGFAAIVFRGSLMSILGPVALTALCCFLLSWAERSPQKHQL